MKQDVIPLAAQLINVLIDLLTSVKSVDKNIPYYELHIKNLHSSKELKTVFYLMIFKKEEINKFVSIQDGELEKEEFVLLQDIIKKCLLKKPIEFYSYDPKFKSLYQAIENVSQAVA
ncbi:hypothetical protein XF24_00951 [candidate division SR1 bacterium Aalborg_AAW-1]|nr:hypothetical protein XF24_00951 [candidate division SR1 bacterium Aalborg_AAW-1]